MDKARCISCGAELHPERAKKYSYCMAPACQEKNLKGLTMVAVGMNKAADELMLLDERTREGLASGRYADQRRSYFGQLESTPAAVCAGAPKRAAEPPPDASRQPAGKPAPRRKPWSVRQQRLAVLYNEQGLRPDEIAQKLGISRYLVTQIILSARNRGKA